MSAPYNPWEGQSGDDFSDLDSYSSQYRPEAAFRPGLEALANGPADFEIVSAALDKTQKSGERICRIILRVVGGITVEWTRFLNEQRNLNRLCADLACLGFDADKWNTPGRPLSKEIPAAVAKLPGIKFRAVKTSRQDTRPGYESKVYHDLQINGRIDGRPMPPLTPPVQTAPAPNGAHTVGAGAAAGGQSDDIPF
ncbi:MAG: hypothetical protein IT429_14885 [Gemmataceae bacterium]|nr:hypothetical protein [Gemmataceae bacterium]